MKFDTKKCSPVRIRPSTTSSSSRGLDERDLVWRNPNKYITEAEDDNRNDGGSGRMSYGRNVEHLPRLVYTPVKVSARTNRGSCSGNSTTRTVTDHEMDDLNASLLLLNLRFDDDPGHTNARDSDEPSQTTDRGGDPLMGRISKEQVDSKTGKLTRVWRSARVAKTVGRS